MSRMTIFYVPRFFDFMPLFNVWHALMSEDGISTFIFFLVNETTSFSIESCSSSGAFSPSVDSFGACIIRAHDLCFVFKPLITILSCLLYCNYIYFMYLRTITNCVELCM